MKSVFAQTHRGGFELALAAALYGMYEVFRGLASDSYELARAHTDSIVALERSFGLFWERDLQAAAERVPSLPAALGAAYIALHFGATALALIWVHRAHRDRFALVRNTLVVATALSLVAYVLFPVAPPRLSNLGFADTVTHSTGLSLSSDLLRGLYNPYAAVPSLHFGYALIVGVALAHLARSRTVRALGWTYAPFMALVIVTTGNHFLFDALAGGVVVAAGYAVARSLTAARATAPRRPGYPRSSVAHALQP